VTIGEPTRVLTDLNTNGTTAAVIRDARGSTTAVTVKGEKTVTRNSQKLLPFSKILAYYPIDWGGGSCAITFRSSLLEFAEDFPLITISEATAPTRAAPCLSA
jgi:hypothetical protein